MTQFADLGAFAEMMLLHERAVLKIADDIPLDRAALLGCAVTTGVGAALNTAQVAPGSTVAVFGAGGVGISVIQGARIAGARQIIAVDIRDNKLEIAKHFGATDAINGAQVDAVREIKRLSGGGVEYSFDAIGNPSVLEQCVYCLAPRGLATRPLVVCSPTANSRNAWVSPQQLPNPAPRPKGGRQASDRLAMPKTCSPPPLSRSARAG